MPDTPPFRRSLAHSIERITEGDQELETPVPHLRLFRREAVTQPCACMIEPSVVLVVQGTKQVLVGNKAYPYDIDRFLLTSLDLPATSQVVAASPREPCLGLVLKLDLQLIAELMAQGAVRPPPQRPAERGLSLGSVSSPLLEAFVRLVKLIDEPHAIPVLSPLIQREIHFRLLLSDQGDRLWQIATTDSQGQRVAKAIEWLKLHFAQPLRVTELASRVQMSPSSLHHHFKQWTTMSPLQYQKCLRLNEARRLMLHEHLDAASAAFRVGYESPSQFSREYSRQFGLPPRRDVDTLLQRHAAS